MPQSELLSKGEEVLFDHFNGSVYIILFLNPVPSVHQWVACFLFD